MLSMTEPAVTAAAATAYHAQTGATGWPATELAQQQAIMRGQRYLAARFNARWTGSWDNDAAPEGVQHAICEAALIEARQPGRLSPVSTPATDKVLVGAGKLVWERVSTSGGADSYVPRTPAVDGLLKGLIAAPSGAQAELLRA